MIARDLEAASRQKYDLAIIGGGIYGAMLALEASLRACSVLLLEKEDFGGATSFNSLRIVHGGLRDLQSLNLGRYRAFGRERRWFLEHFPELAHPLPVLVPLYQRGVLRTELFRMAFLLDRWLLPQRDRTPAGRRQLPHGKVIAPAKVQQHFSAVDRQNLRGGALWYDAGVPDSQRLLMEVLRCACALGATALNYTPARDVLVEQERVVGVQAHDGIDGAAYTFRADTVINAAGPWCRTLARRFGQDAADLYRPSIAWNILFDRPAPSNCALGVTPPTAEGQIYFVHPWKGRLLAGTGHAPRTAREEPPRPSPEEIDGFLEDLNRALPALSVGHDDILHVFAGHLPVKEAGTTRLTKADRLIDHAKRGGPAGLFSIESTKLTAARRTADKTMTRLFPGRPVAPSKRNAFQALCRNRPARGVLFDYHWRPGEEETAWREPLKRIIREEAVCHLDDLVIRRTSLGDDPRRAIAMAPALCTLFDWDAARCRNEVGRVKAQYPWMSKPSAASRVEHG